MFQERLEKWTRSPSADWMVAVRSHSPCTANCLAVGLPAHYYRIQGACYRVRLSEMHCSRSVGACLRLLTVAAAVIGTEGWLATSSAVAGCGDYVAVAHPVRETSPVRPESTTPALPAAPFSPCTSASCSIPGHDFLAGPVPPPPGPEQWALPLSTRHASSQQTTSLRLSDAAGCSEPFPSQIFHPPR